MIAWEGHVQSLVAQEVAGVLDDQVDRGLFDVIRYCFARDPESTLHNKDYSTDGAASGAGDVGAHPDTGEAACKLRTMGP